MVKKKITKKEIRTRIGFILLGFFTFYLVSPIKEIVDVNIQLSLSQQLIIGGIGILATLYYFNF